MGEVMVSVIMPIYNMQRFLNEAIDSVLRQTYKNWELILVDDCSSDASLDICRSYEQSDSRIHVIKLDHNMGVANARNRGIEYAGGKYTALLDSDDIWNSNKLEIQLKLLEDSGAQIVYCSYDLIDENGKKLKKPFIVPKSTDFSHMLINNVISCSTAIIETELLRKNPFDQNVYHEDYVLWLRLLSDTNVRAFGTQKILAGYRQVSGSRSGDKLNSAVKRWQIYRKILNYGFIKSARMFAGYLFNAFRKYF